MRYNADYDEGGKNLDSVIYNPLKEYEENLKADHFDNARSFFENLVKQSGVNIEENRRTVEQYNNYQETLKKLKRKLNKLRFFRVIMIITIILIPVVIMKLTPKIKELREEIADSDKKVEELMSDAKEQMQPLNSLFTDRDGLNIIQKTIPMLVFDPCFTVRQEMDMKINFDFKDDSYNDQSTLSVLAGSYNNNPFLFENKLIHTMGTETYYGTKKISWTEAYTDSAGKVKHRTRSETLRASVTKPKPFYNTQVVLTYGSQAGPELSFSRDATHLERKSDRSLERHIKKGERKLKRRTDKAISSGDDFVSMSNSEFEVLFDALDRTDEVQFRTIFTPLAQTNMVELILSDTTYGDDFNFIKSGRMNKIVSNHSNGRALNLTASNYTSYSFDVIKQSFLDKNAEFFKKVYFDFAPLWAIPAYQERPIQSLKPIPDYSQLYSLKECEALANAVDKKYVVHPKSATQAILKSKYVGSKEKTDETCITAYSYEIIERIDAVPVRGGDGRYHNVPVHWEEYLPLKKSTDFYVAESEAAQGNNVIASRNGLCMFN